MNRKKTSKLFDTPEKDFNTWAIEHGVEISEESQEKTEKQFRLKKWLLVTVPIFLMLIIIMPIIIYGGQNGSDDIILPEPPRYELDDATKNYFSLEELFAIEGIIEFNFEDAEYEQVLKYIADDNKDLILGYSVSGVHIPIQNGNDFFVIRMDYVIRSYKNFEFGMMSSFEVLNENYLLGELSIDYRLYANSADIYFKHDSLEYFISVYGVQGFPQLNETYLKAFLNHLLN